MFSLDPAILLGCVDTTPLVDDALSLKKICHAKLSSIVTSNGFDFSVKLSFN
jgi:hypothetical protein